MSFLFFIKQNAVPILFANHSINVSDTTEKIRAKNKYERNEKRY